MPYRQHPSTRPFTPAPGVPCSINERTGYLRAAENLAGAADAEAGFNSGSDGTRTRDLWRDRPAL
jgi:hypothetical protein